MTLNPKYLGMEQWNRFLRIYKGNICAWPQRCDTDTGGPLICNNTLLGIHNWGTLSNDEKCLWIPSVYTSIPHYGNWIKTQIDGYFNNGIDRKFHFAKKKKKKNDSKSLKTSVILIAATIKFWLKIW